MSGDCTFYQFNEAVNLSMFPDSFKVANITLFSKKGTQKQSYPKSSKKL